MATSNNSPSLWWVYVYTKSLNGEPYRSMYVAPGFTGKEAAKIVRARFRSVSPSRTIDRTTVRRVADGCEWMGGSPA